MFGEILETAGELLAGIGTVLLIVFGVLGLLSLIIWDTRFVLSPISLRIGIVGLGFDLTAALLAFWEERLR